MQRRSQRWAQRWTGCWWGITTGVRVSLACLMIGSSNLAQAQLFRGQSCGTYVSQKLKRLANTSLIYKREGQKRLKWWGAHALLYNPHLWISEPFRIKYRPGWVPSLAEAYFYIDFFYWLVLYAMVYTQYGMSPAELEQHEQQLAKAVLDQTPVLALIDLLLILAKEGLRQQGMTDAEVDMQLAEARKAIVLQYQGYLRDLKAKPRIDLWSDEEVMVAIKNYPSMFLDPFTWVPLSQVEESEDLKIQIARRIMQAHQDAIYDVLVLVETGQLNPVRYNEKYFPGFKIQDMVRELYQTQPPKVSKEHIASLLVIAIHLTLALNVREFYERQGLSIPFELRETHEQWVKKMLTLVHRRKAIEAEKRRREAGALTPMPDPSLQKR